MAGEQEVGDDPDGPHVTALVVAHALEVGHVHLGRDVVARAHQTVHVVSVVHELRVRGRRRTHLAQSEIDQLHFGVGGVVRKHDVGELQVTVRDVLRLVQVGNGVENLLDHSLRVLLRELSHYASLEQGTRYWDCLQGECTIRHRRAAP